MAGNQSGNDILTRFVCSNFPTLACVCVCNGQGNVRHHGSRLVGYSPNNRGFLGPNDGSKSEHGERLSKPTYTAAVHVVPSNRLVVKPVLRLVEIEPRVCHCPTWNHPHT